MKTIKRITVISLIAIAFFSCKKEDSANEVKLDLKTDSGYSYSDASLAGGTTIKVGIEAETEKKKDPLVKFNISESVNGGYAGTVYTETIDDKTDFEYDYTFVLDTVSGSTHEYTFTVTNRDGINAQESITYTVN